MSEEQKNNPLHGIKLETLLTELVEYYGFSVLATQININCFKSNPSIKSSLKFLRRTEWARNRVEAFYLYRFKNLPRPTDEDFNLPPRERPIALDTGARLPEKLSEEDQEFFDDPESGYQPTEPGMKVSRRKVEHAPVVKRKPQGDSPDPWAKWKEKNE
jgi:uncharacterized protein (DUF2132 family)